MRVAIATRPPTVISIRESRSGGFPEAVIRQTVHSLPSAVMDERGKPGSRLAEIAGREGDGSGQRSGAGPGSRARHGRPGRPCGSGDGQRAARRTDGGPARGTGPPKGRRGGHADSVEEPDLHRRPGDRQDPGRQSCHPHLHRARAPVIRAPARDRRRRPGRGHPAGDRDAGGRGGQARERRPADDQRRARLVRSARSRPASAPLPVQGAHRLGPAQP